jgi:hypothetical protein
LELYDFAMSKIAIEEQKVHTQVSQFQKNRLALEFIKLNQDIMKHSKIVPRANESKDTGKNGLLRRMTLK